MENSLSNPALEQISDSQVLGSTPSLSLPSEPPDVRNWFSSYEYESPALDSNENFGDSVSKEVQFAKSDLVIEESDGEEEENPGGLKKIRKRDEEFVAEKLCSNGCSSFLGSDKLDGPSLNKLTYSLHSPSLLSEPPDIRNWFASYVYESPVLDTSNCFGDCLSKESECEYDGFVNEESNIETEETLGELIVGENVHSDGVVKCNNCSGNNELKRHSTREGDGVGGNGNPSAQNNSSFGRHFKQTLILEGSQCKLEQPQTTSSMPANISKTSGCDDRKSLIYKRNSTWESSEVKVETEVDHLSPESNLKSNLVIGIAMEKSKQGSGGKESEGKDISEKGFVTTRNINFTRISYENSLRRPEGTSKRTVPLTGVKERKVLAETTNFQYSDAMEVTGKWRCPQKSKPNVGPPLKQLRLGQWIHRM